MKRILFPVFLSISLLTQAQYDTLMMGEREPTFYYWGEVWLDHIFADTGYQAFYDNMQSLAGGGPFAALEIARCCYSKDTLKVIGVAAPIQILYTPPSSSSLTIYDTNLLPEYFRIFYYHGPTEAESPYLAQARYDNFKPRYVTCVGGGGYDSNPVYEPVYEAYFDEPVSVIDTFYVSITHENNYYIHADSTPFYFGGMRYWYYNSYHAHPITASFCTIPKYMATYIWDLPFGKPLFKSNYCDEINDWNIEHYQWGNLVQFGTEAVFFHHFPIFDTSTYTDTTATTLCPPPDALRVPLPDAESSVLMWNSQNSQEWDVSLCVGCTDPDSGTISHHTTTFANLTNLVPGATYTAWVRSYCMNGDTTHWSEGLQFYVPVPADTGSNRVVPHVDDAYFHLSPNPAKVVVSAFSSFKMREIDIYSMAGVLMKHETVESISANIDISSLPKGSYIVRAKTTHGMSYARLVVQ